MRKEVLAKKEEHCGIDNKQQLLAINLREKRDGENEKRDDGRYL